MHDDILKAMSMKHALRSNSNNVQVDNTGDNIKMGEDVGGPDTPTTLTQIINDPLNAILPNRRYYGRKTKAAVYKSQRQHKTVQNARRVEGTKKVLVKGYNYAE